MRVGAVRRASVLVLLVLGSAASSRLCAQQAGETVRGRVVNDSGRPIPDATVTVTRAPDRESRVARTDAGGSYSVFFEQGTGDYLVHVNAPGWESFRRRLMRTGSDSVLVLDVTLAAERTTQLAPVVARAQRTAPPKTPGIDVGTGAAERLADGVNGALPPDQEGNLAAIAATVPGASVTGFPAGQNQVTLNGMGFAGTDLPRDARIRTRVSSSTYDPARGGFSGTQTAVEVAAGGLYSFQRAHVTVDAPWLQLADRVSDALGNRYSNLQVSAGGDGELVENRYYYNLSAQATRRTSDVVTVGSAPAEVFRSFGVAPDSAARLLSVLGGFGIPTRTGNGPGARTTESYSFLARLDHAPRSTRGSWNLLGYGKLNRSDAVGAGPTATLASGGRTSGALAMLQADVSFYPRRYVLSDTRTALTFASDRGRPYLALPSGRVLVASELDSLSTLSSLGFGGNSALRHDRRDWTWETTNETQWHSWGDVHRTKLYLQSRIDGYARAAESSLGTFTYASLADLAANRPASFARQLGVPASSGSVWNGAAAVGDLWRVSPFFRVLYGARLEGNRYLAGAPRENPLVRATFGVPNDAVPSGVHLSPRFGFTWIYSGADPRTTVTTTTLGTQYRGPAGSIRGGLGEFRGLLPADLPAAAATSTGLTGAATSVLCVGEAVPVPDWEAYLQDPALVPAGCNPAAPSGALAETAPTVNLLDPSFDAPRSWRANLGWIGQAGPLGLSVDGVLSLGLDQPGTFDLNFSGVPRFTLAEEGGRPVFVRPGSIVPETGVSTGSDARLSPLFGRVVRHDSDLRVVSRQVTVMVTPDLPNPAFFVSAAYTLGSARARYRGFDGATFGNPAELEWAPSDFDVRHQVQLQGGWTNPRFSLTLFATLVSGTPFTPLVSGDVNGDGLANDRAFVFSPESAADPELQEGMQTLLDSGPASARSCLARQLGRPAARNSCRGPWTQLLNARLALTPRLPFTRHRADLSLNFANVLSGIDLLLHGSSDLRGWGNPVRPDPVLYRVRGFDPAAQRFRYDVNPRFGDVSASSRLLGAPFRITIDIRVDLGRRLQVQQLERFLRPGRAGRPGTRPSADSLVKRYERTVPDIYELTLQQSDSLLLSPAQVQALKTAQIGYREKMTAVWRELAEYLAALPDTFNAAEALRRQEATTDQAWEVSRLEGPTIKSILSPLQQRLLPGMVAYLINEKGKVRIRYFTG